MAQEISYRERGRTALAAGRFLEAAEWYERARTLPIDGEPALLTLEEAEALLGLGRFGDALRAVTRAIHRRPRAADLRGRLHVVRALALWELGRTRLALDELRRASRDGRCPRTLARIDEALARFAWRAGDLAEALGHLGRARAVYEAEDAQEGVARTLETESAVLRDAGTLDEALAANARRLSLAGQTSRVDAVARARADRGTLLIALGRWSEAREELDLAACLFREAGDPREVSVAGVARAVVDLAMGDLAAARRGLELAVDQDGEDGGSVRALGEDLLLLADVYLAAGQPEGAEEICARAQAIFVSVRDKGGECWARIRRSQALLALGQAGAAVREARRAEAQVPASKVHVRAWALLALGRALLRSSRREAAEAFGRARELVQGRPVMVALADVGLNVAQGVSPDDPTLTEAIQRLESWGDRRLASLSLGDVREYLGVVHTAGSIGLPRALPLDSGDDSGRVLVDASEALVAGGTWVHAALALRPWLPWCRMVWLGGEAWEARDTDVRARPLGSHDLATDLRSLVTPPAFVSLDPCGVLRRHPTRALYDLGAAAVVPVVGGEVLYADFARSVLNVVGPERALATLAQLVRLVLIHGAAPSAESRFRGPLPGLIGESAAMRQIYARIEQAAPWDVPIHVVGETGTGKELVARAIHDLSPRARREFVAVNASSLSDELFESEMFGHARGAFTGAIAATDGLVARAEGGTLFIDEVADLSPRAQGKLLRFLQNGEYLRVGEATRRRANVRIVSAANVDLKQRAATERFRHDLLYRLCDWVLDLPPLRERGDDILILARHFASELSERHGRAVPSLPGDVARLLRGYAWPGNVRQLQSEIRRLMVRSGSGPLRRCHLSPEVLGGTDAGGAALPSLREARLDFERQHIGQALNRNSGNRARTAAVLGLTRQGLLNKIQQFGLT